MWLITVIAPVVIVGGIVVFVIKRMEHKYNQGKLGKKKSKGAQQLLDSLIPMGMLLGCLIGIIVDIFFPGYSLFTVGLGAGIGYLFGFFAYEIYSKTGNDFS
ncbi:hypothetical protein [Bacillus nitratireducens]|uniref:hypothetical protein n=1 Tax=Bacillus nitratireducens TaxID=2026193 RepID=UPI00077AC18B|nr:hypothetical protein [Bacillus nitratireducens]KXY42818.1 hypothetical protein AT257_19065 [Bacillus cereus]QUG82900.1 hypothetical protein GSN03_05345 [Bacillus nitratireducens]